MLFFKNRYISLASADVICRYLLLAFMFLILGKTHAQIPTDTLFIKADGTYPLNKHLYIVEKPNHSTVQSIITQESRANFKKIYPDNFIDIGVAKNYYWLVFTIKNSSPSDDTYYFQLHYPGANLAYAYAKTGNDYRLIGKSGTRLPFKVRPYPNYDIVFPLQLRTGAASTYLIMIDKYGESLNMRPTLSSNSVFQAEENYLYTFYGLIAGIMLTNLIVNLFLFVSLKQRIHLLYSGYVFMMLCWIFTGDGIDYQFIFPDYPQIPAISEFVVTSLGLIMMSYLITSFLELNKYNCRFLRPIVAVRYFLMLLIPISYPVFISYDNLNWPKEIYLYTSILASCLAVILFISAAIQRAMQKYKPAWFYLASVTYLGFAIIEYCFYILGFNIGSRIYMRPSNIQIGILIETVIIFLGIIYRYNLYKKEKVSLLLKISEQQQEIAQQIVAAQEEERKRLAQDLHDDVGATLSTLLLHVSNTPEDNHWNKEESIKHNEKSVAISKKALADLRLISHNLLPKDFSSLGIFRILQNKIEELNGFGLIDFRLVTAGDDKPLSHILSITIYRIINELINNVIKHSMASYCNVELVIDKAHLMLIIEDNGAGITAKGVEYGIGLKNIKSRVEFLNGLLNIDGNRKGTSIIVDIPLNQNNYGK